MQIIFRSKKGDKILDLKRLFLTIIVYVVIFTIPLSLGLIQKVIYKYKAVIEIEKRIAAQKVIIDALSKQEFGLNKRCPLTNKHLINYVIYGNGHLKLGKNFKNSDLDNADLIIFHGADVKQFVIFLEKGEKYFENFAEKKEIIITPLALWALKISEYKTLFNKYINNYKKTGDIFNPNGKVFYYIDEFDFNVQGDLAGITFSIPGNDIITNAKNYGLGHLLESDFSLRGLENPITFLEFIKFPKPKGFEGTFGDLIKQAKKEYHLKYLPNVIAMEPRGVKISRNLFPIAPKKKDKYLPLIKVLKLSKNVYLSSLEKATQ